MDNIETFHNKKMVVAETGGLRFEADLFKSVPILLGFVYHKKMVVAGTIGF